MAVTRQAQSPSGETSRSNFATLSIRDYRATRDGPKLAARPLEAMQPLRKRAAYEPTDIFRVDSASHSHAKRERVAHMSSYYHHAPCPSQWPPADHFNSQPQYPSSHCSQLDYARSFAPRGPFILQLPATSASMTTTIQMLPPVPPQYSWAPSPACWQPKLPSSTRTASPQQGGVQNSSAWSPGTAFKDASSPPAPMPDTTDTRSFQSNLLTARRNASVSSADVAAAGSSIQYGSHLPRQVSTSPLPTKKRIRHAPFPKKLYEIVMANPGVVTWHEESRALIVRDPRRFSAEIMPRYFNTNGGDGILKSFTRQLNYYGFHRVSLHLTNSSASTSTPAQPTKERGAIEDQSPFLLLNLRGSQVAAACVQADRPLTWTGQRNWSHDTPLHFFRNYFGNEALVFVNKDRTIKEPADFGRLIRFEKAASRIAIHAR